MGCVALIARPAEAAGTVAHTQNLHGVLFCTVPNGFLREYKRSNAKFKNNTETIQNKNLNS